MGVTKTFKVTLCGESAVGKTAFLWKNLTGNYTQKHRATIGADIHDLSFDTNYGKIGFEVWDIAGHEKFGGLVDGYFIGTKATIVMGSISNTNNQFAKWMRMVNRVDQNVKFVIAYNKKDLSLKVPPTQTVYKGKTVPVCTVSTLTGENLSSPFLALARNLTGHADLVFT